MTAQITKPVSVGDDGRNADPASADGPLLTALKGYFDKVQARYEAALKAHRTELRQMLMLSTPNVVPVVASGVYPASGSLHLDLGGPQIGRKWHVRLLKVANGHSVGDTLTGTAQWYVGQPPTVLGRSSPVNWVWSFATLPGIQNFTSDSIAITPQDHLYCTISSGSSGQLAMAAALVLDYPVLPSTGGIGVTDL